MTDLPIEPKPHRVEIRASTVVQGWDILINDTVVKHLISANAPRVTSDADGVHYTHEDITYDIPWPT